MVINWLKSAFFFFHSSLFKAVPEPTPEEVWQVVKDPQGPIGLPWAFERDKAYSRDFWRRGRFRFQLKDENKGLLKPNIPNRELRGDLEQQ